MKKNSTILIVDDTHKNLQVLGTMLQDLGYEVAFSDNGKQALTIAHKVVPDLILLDVMMPEMDGLEVCRQLKCSSRTDMIPVIFLTAKSEPENVVTGLYMGAVDYITKPFNKTELIARVKTHLALKQTQSELEEKNKALEKALEEIKILRGILPICTQCKKIRDDEGLWERVEKYIESRSEVSFSHGLCPDCARNLYGDEDWFDGDDQT